MYAVKRSPRNMPLTLTHVGAWLGRRERRHHGHLRRCGIGPSPFDLHGPLSGHDISLVTCLSLSVRHQHCISCCCQGERLCWKLLPTKPEGDISTCGHFPGVDSSVSRVESVLLLNFNPRNGLRNHAGCSGTCFRPLLGVFARKPRAANVLPMVLLATWE